MQNGFYIILDCNEFYIPKRRRAGKVNFPHSELIHGYDSNTETFAVYGFTSKGYFETTPVTFADMVRSIDSAPLKPSTKFDDDENNLRFVSLDTKTRIKYDIHKTVKCLWQYIVSSNLIDDLAIYFCSDGHTFNASWLDKDYRVYSRENIV